MNATIKLEKEKHFPVLIDKIVSIISPHYGGTFIDCTFGQGGYTKKILEFKKNQVIAIDRDIETQEIVNKFKKNYKDRFSFDNKKFSEVTDLKYKIDNLKGIIFDLGYSTNQIKDLKKGLSFKSSGKLNMKMGLNDFSANEVINKLEDKDLEKILRYFGDEKEAKFISKNIVKERESGDIDTQNLVSIIEKTKRKKNYKINSSTKSFQAIRIFVNKEISELIYGLIHSAKILKKNGVLAVVTFHSLEDKIVKYFFKSLSEHKSVSRYEPKIAQEENLFEMPNKKPIVPSDDELNKNLPSRSAKLRYLIKKEDTFEIKTDVLKKFSHLIEIENLGSKL